jgi:prepilin signal peptidase PulO-like enzyme (type II secretory pathway)
MNAFAITIHNIAFLLLSTVGSIGLRMLYNRMPPAWFREHPAAAARGETPPDRLEPEIFPSYSLRKFPDTVLFCFSLVFFSFVFFIQYGYSLLLICNLVPLLFFGMLFAADIKTGILPDQFVVGLAFSSLLWIVYDISVLLTTGQPLYYAFSGRIPAAFSAAAILFLIGRIGSLLMKQDAMGMGDVKLIFACGLIVDFAGIFWVILLSFLLAWIPSLIGLIGRKRRAAVSDAAETAGVFKANQLPFAPFIVSASLLYMIFPAEFAWIASWYSGL